VELYVDETLELWLIFGSFIVPIFKVTERSSLGSLWRKVEGQSIVRL